MSVINNVLRDLDARRRTPVASAAPPAGLSAVPGRSGRRVLLFGLLAASLAVAGITLVGVNKLPDPLRGWVAALVPGASKPAAPVVAAKNANGAAASVPGLVVAGGKPADPDLKLDTGTGLGVGKMVSSVVSSAGNAMIDSVTPAGRARESARGMLGKVTSTMAGEAPPGEKEERKRPTPNSPILLAMPSPAGATASPATAGAAGASDPAAAAAVASAAGVAVKSLAPVLAAPASRAAQQEVLANSQGDARELARRARKPARPAGDADELVDDSVPGQPRTIRSSSAVNKVQVEFDSAVNLLHEGKIDLAIDRLQRLLAAHPQHVRAREVLIATLIDVRRIDEAAGLARDGLALNPAQPKLAMTLARLQLERGELAPAIATLEATKNHAGNQPVYHAFLAALVQRAGRYRDAADHYTIALRTVPQNGVWWMGLGISYQALKQDAEAEQAFRRARAAGGLSPELQTFVGNRLSQLQK
ncbi:tetratricopeptide repeat protein [Lacisediminimonas profundi]|uniref:tetratricopeptide repeat protein n=1 Tax=Lacisediminimonas profundi TaxID=2603856 RepID=UPI00124B93AB|nr:tetratricopeptide repeat protein [Lacisediminimonas profundi]